MFCFVCSLPVLCLAPVRLLFSALCSLLSVNQSISTVICSSQLYSKGGGGLRSPEASMLARIIAYGAWRREIMFMHLMWENSSLLISITCSVLDVKSHLSHQHILNQLETAVLDSTHTMHLLSACIKMKSSSKHLV